MIDSVADVEAEINRIIGNRDNIEFKFKIDPVDIDSLIQKGEVKFEDEITDENCLMYGGSFGFKPGNRWEVIKNFKGKSHSQGGIEINIGKGRVTMGNHKGAFIAANGVIISKDNISWENK